MADKVQRYEPLDERRDVFGGHAGMEASGTGDYVLHSDYAKLETELRDTKQKLAILFDSSCYSDSLGVEGSSFTVCRWCGGGSSPGKGDFKHNTGCLFDDDALEQRVKDVWEEVPELETELRDTRRALEMVAWGSERFWLDEARLERTEEIKGRLGE